MTHLSLRPAGVFILAVFIASGLAGCSGSATTGTSGGSGDPGGAPGGSGRVVDVVASEFRFDPSTITVAAGNVTFDVRNTGAAEHEFEILKGDQVVDELEGLVPGLERTLTVRLEPGQYRYICALPGHEERGMKGTLTVTAS